MYFNDVHIILYLIIAVIGFIVGKFIAWCNECFPEEKIIQKYLKKQNTKD